MIKNYFFFLVSSLCFFCQMHAQDTTALRFASFSDSGELFLYDDDSTNLYSVVIDANASFNAMFQDPVGGKLYCLYDSIALVGDRNIYEFDPFSTILTRVYDLAPQFLAAACFANDGLLYAVTGNSVLPGEIYEIDIQNQTTTLLTTTDFTFGGNQTALNITYYAPSNELWLFGGAADSLIKINRSTLNEQRVACAMNADGGIKGTYVEDSIFWLISNMSYNLNLNHGLFTTPSSFSVPGYVTGLVKLDMVEGADTMGICDGDSITLRSRFRADDFYWYLNDTALGIQNRSITVATPGTYQVLIQVDNAYYMWSEKIEVVIATSPSAGFTQSADTIFTGQFVTFTDSSNGGTRNSWAFGDGDTSSLASPSHIYATAGVYTVMQMISTGLCTDTAYGQVVVLPLVGLPSPLSNNTIISFDCIPNPTRSRAEVRLELASTENVRLEIFDLMGARIATLHDGVLESGAYVFPWNAINSQGVAVESGFYFLRLMTNGQALSKRILVMQ